MWILLGGNTLTQIGVGFFFPILPIFIGRKGGSACRASRLAQRDTTRIPTRRTVIDRRGVHGCILG